MNKKHIIFYVFCILLFIMCFFNFKYLINNKLLKEEIYFLNEKNLDLQSQIEIKIEENDKLNEEKEKLILENKEYKNLIDNLQKQNEEYKKKLR